MASGADRKHCLGSRIMRIAIVGCGQLSSMMALAGLPLGIKFSFIQDDINQSISCVEGLGLIQQSPKKDKDTKDYDAKDIKQLYHDLGKPDCITVEKEQVDLALLKALTVLCSIYPSVDAISLCQHRGREKQLLANLNIPTSPYFLNKSALETAGKLGYPLVVKSCTEGYDGKNKWRFNNSSDAKHFDELNVQEYIIEAFVPFDKEISLISVRSKQGYIEHYSLTDNVHEKGILTRSIAPAVNISDKLRLKAQAYMESLLNKLDYVGVMAMECFVIGEQLMINELAPRVHNSGHWTQLGSITCQFENHIRAIAGIQLGSTQQISPTGMLNIIGIEKPSFELLAENTKLYWYNKSVKPLRKLGHINFIGKNHKIVSQQMALFD